MNLRERVEVDWNEYRDTIIVPEIQELCDIAIALENAYNIVERGINANHVYSRDLRKMQELAKRLIYNILSAIRKMARKVGYDEEKLEKKDGIVKNLENLLAFTERDKVNIAGELRSQTPNYPFINQDAMARVYEILYVYLADVLTDVLKFEKTILEREFVLSSISRRNLTVSPDFLKKLEEEGKSKTGE